MILILYNLITSLKAKGIINNGLTIPYVIGGIKTINETLVLDYNSVKILLEEIINSNLSNDVIILQKCPDINQFVIKIENANFADKYLQKEIIFKNKEDRKTFYITQNASSLGNSVDEITANLNKLYLTNILEETFSWSNSSNQWFHFTDEEINIIKSSYTS